jgi:hypothetical protein
VIKRPGLDTDHPPPPNVFVPPIEFYGVEFAIILTEITCFLMVMYCRLYDNACSATKDTLVLRVGGRSLFRQYEITVERVTCFTTSTKFRKYQLFGKNDVDRQTTCTETIKPEVFRHPKMKIALKDAVGTNSFPLRIFKAYGGV